MSKTDDEILAILCKQMEDVINASIELSEEEVDRVMSGRVVFEVIPKEKEGVDL